MPSIKLYPPELTVDTVAFTDFCRLKVYLPSISFSNFEDVKSLHIKVTNAATSESVINKEQTFCKSGICVKNNIRYTEGGQRYIVIDLKDEVIWTNGGKYLIQVRFSEIEMPSSGIDESSWLVSKSNFFSEWSASVLVKKTAQPNIVLSSIDYNSKDANNSNLTRSYSISSPSLVLKGNYINDEDKSEKLFKYRIKVYNEETNTELDDSGEITSINNIISYKVKYLFTDYKKVKIIFSYETINKYQEALNIPISIDPVVENKIDYVLGVSDLEDNPCKDWFNDRNLSVSKETDNGVIIVHGQFLPSKNDTKIDTNWVGNIYLLRTDSNSNFQRWDEIQIIPKECDQSDFTFYDFCIESHVTYRYVIQPQRQGDLRESINMDKKVEATRHLDHSFLIYNGDEVTMDIGNQFKLSLNFNISDYSYTIQEQQMETIGGKYPIIARNGHIKYRSLPITGMLSYNMGYVDFGIRDFNSLKTFNEKGEPIKIDYDFTDPQKEQVFREFFLEILQSGKPLLLKTSAEGNIIGRAINVKTTPNSTLGRHVSDFSFTFVEIAEANIDNYLKYNFTSLGEKYILNKTESAIGRIEGNLVGQNIIELIKNKYNQQVENENYVVNTIKNVIMRFDESKNNQRVLAINRDNILIAYTDIYSLDQMIFNGNDTITLSENENVIIDFEYDYTVYPYADTVERDVASERILGRFYKDDRQDCSDIYNQIQNKYNVIINDNKREELLYLTRVVLYAQEGTSFSIEVKDQGKNDIIMNSTEVYEINANIIDLKISSSTESRPILVDYEGVVIHKQRVKEEDFKEYDY